MLVGPEAHHLIHVMRLRPGQQTTLFDGSGREFTALVERVGRTEVELTITAQEEVDRELPLRLVLGVALPKGDRQKWLVEKTVELGVARLVPLETARGVAQPVEQALGRLRRAVIEASKQCGRNRLLEIASPQRFSDFVQATGNMPWRLLAHPHCGQAGQGSVMDFQKSNVAHNSRRREPTVREGHCSEPPASAGGYDTTFLKLDEFGKIAQAKATADRAAAHGPPGEVALGVGPEGGFDDEEVALALATGWTRVDLGPRILRVETAAVALVAGVTMPWLRSGPWRGSWQSP
jgi:16S rRNA (uracil1498-N3)-methyltransferase